MHVHACHAYCIHVHVQTINSNAHILRALNITHIPYAGLSTPAVLARVSHACKISPNLLQTSS